jgi:hypothetical protein
MLIGLALHVPDWPLTLTAQNHLDGRLIAGRVRNMNSSRVAERLDFCPSPAYNTHHFAH